MRPLSRLIPLVSLAATASMAYYMPVYTPIYVPMSYNNGPVYKLETMGEVATVKLAGSDTLLRVGDTVGLFVEAPSLSSQISSPAPVRGWMDSLAPTMDSSIRASVGLAVALLPAKPTGVVDTLQVEPESARRSGGRGGSISEGNLRPARKFELPRPEAIFGAKAILVVVQGILPRDVVPKGGTQSKVADLQAAWGLWRQDSAKWVAWGLAPLRTSNTDLSKYSAAAAGEKVAKSILEAAPVPSSISDIRRSERKSKYGGLLLGVNLGAGFHTSGDLKDMVKSWDSEYGVEEFQFGLEAGWYAGAWGVGVSIPLRKTISVEQSYTDQSGQAQSESKTMWVATAPSAEVIGLLPVGGSAITAAVGFGYMSMKGEQWGDLRFADGSGTFWYPKVGFYSPFKYAYFATDLGLQMQSFDFGGSGLKATVFFFDLRFGLRLAHD